MDPSPEAGPAAPGPLQSLWTLVDNLDACFYVKDVDGRYLFANRALGLVFNAEPSAIVGRGDGDFVDLTRCDTITVTDREVFATGAKLDRDEVLYLPGSGPRTFRTVKLPLFDAQRRVVGLCGISTDITEQRRTVDELIRRNLLLDTILSNVDSSIFMKDRDGRYLYANRRVLDMLGVELDELVGRTDSDFLPPEVAAPLRENDRAVLAGHARAVEELVTDTHGNKHLFWTRKIPIDLPGHPGGLLALSTEITELRGLRQRLEEERVTDSLTGLANRIRFESALDATLQMARPGGGQPAVVIIDLDQFRYINNNFGQAVGDRLIQVVGTRLQQCGVPIGHLARLSGDEFAFTLPQAGSIENLARQVEQIRAFLSQPYPVQHPPLHLTFSAGISLSGVDGNSANELLGRAEAAMYSAKDNGRDQYRFYSRSLGSTVAERVALERDLRAAMGSGEFTLHYQPKMRRDGTVAGFEALIRWNRPGVGLVAPDRFIPLAEQLGLLLGLGRWVIDEACRQIARWRTEGMGEVPVAVNLSTSQLTSAELPDYVFETIRRHALAPGSLEMELTESMMMSDPELAIDILNRLRRGGVTLSIDDFGTGFSSMAYLRQLPVNYLKLDRSFVQNIADDPKDADLCAGIMALAHKLDMHVVAEGVETSEQHAALAAANCDLFQGFLFSRPMSAAQATEFLRR